MIASKMTAPTLLRHVARTLDVRLSIESAEFVAHNAELVLVGPDAKRAVELVRGRSDELVRLLKSRVDWFADAGLRERMS